MKVLDELKRKLPEYTERYCKRIADSIERKTSKNLDVAINYLSDIMDAPFIYTMHTRDEKTIIYEINVCGKQVAFLEFGTGSSTDLYSIGLKVSEYLPSIAHRVPARGSYGKHKGKQKHWGFYPSYMGNVSTYNVDFELTYKKYTSKKTGAEKIYPLKKPVIITQGLPPLRMIYRAVQETKREVGKWKL